MVEVEADTLDEVKDTIISKVRSLDRVRSTLTMIVAEGYQSM